MKKKLICCVRNDLCPSLQVRLVQTRLVQTLPGAVLALEGYGPHRRLGIREAPNTRGPGCGDRSAHGSTT